MAENLRPEHPAIERDFLRLDFAVLALPRSATTWAANWLTTDQSICWHDPVAHSTPHEMDGKPSAMRYRGISCTGSWMFKNWAPPARTIILERPIDQVQNSLDKLGLPRMSDSDIQLFQSFPGMRVPYHSLFDHRARKVWSYLLPDIPFNAERHEQLAQMVIQPDFNCVPDTSALRRVMKEMANGY